MKRTVVLVAGVMALGVAAYLGSRLEAQPGAAPQSRIALVNLNQVIKSYLKYQVWEKEQENLYKDFKSQLDKSQAQVTQMQSDLQLIPPTDAAKREAKEKQIRDYQRQMQDWGEEVKKTIGKKRDDLSVGIYQEVRDAVQHYARAQHLELVLHYNDAVPGPDMDHPVNVQRKLLMPAAMPFYAADGLDITKQITDMLNQRYNAAVGGAGAGAPAGRQ